MVWTLAVLVPTHMGEDAVIPSFVLSRVELVTYFFASCGVGSSVSWLGDSVRGWLWCSINLVARDSLWGGGVYHKRCVLLFRLLNECPDVDIFLGGIPLQSGILCSRSPEEVIVVDALVCLVVGKEHHHEWGSGSSAVDGEEKTRTQRWGDLDTGHKDIRSMPLATWQGLPPRGIVCLPLRVSRVTWDIRIVPLRSNSSLKDTCLPLQMRWCMCLGTPRWRMKR